MLDSLALLRAMNGIHEEDVVMAGNTYFNERKLTRLKTKRIVTLALAAALILALSVGAWAAYGKVAGPQEAERVALQELEVWKELGLICPEVSFEGPATKIVEVEEEQGGGYWYDRLFPHSYEVRWYGTGKYNCNLSVDTQSGKLNYAVIGALPDETDEPVDTVVSQQPIDPYDLDKGFDSITLYVYDCFDDIVPADLTVDEFCSRLAEYWGFTGYRIGDTVDELWYDTHWEAIDGSTRVLDLPRINPTNYYLTVFFDGDQEGAPMYLELENFPENCTLMLGARHAIG